MYIIKTEQTFAAAHFLKGYEGKCSNLHGHEWKVEARIFSEGLIPEGSCRDMVMDFSDLKQALTDLLEPFDHVTIAEAGSLAPRTLEAFSEEGFTVVEVPFRPTAESFARYFYEELKKAGYPVSDVTVYETSGNSAIYREESTC